MFYEVLKVSSIFNLQYYNIPDIICKQNSDDFIVTLLDDNGNEIDYVLLDSIEYDDHVYVYLVEKEHYDDEEQELYIMEFIEDNGEVLFNTVDNEILLDELYNEFMQSQEEEDGEE